MSGQLLYGLLGDEHLNFDPVDVLDRWLESRALGELDLLGEAALPTVVEWDTYPPRYHLTTADRLIAWVLEDAYEGEVDEGWGDDVAASANRPEVLAIADALLDVIAERVTYRMARTEVRSLPVTADASGELLIDGHPTGRRLPVDEGVVEQAEGVLVADRIRRVFVVDGEVHRG